MITNDELRKILRAAIKKSGNNISRWARENGFETQRGNISEMAHGNRKISEAVGERLGYEKPDCWEKKPDGTR